jgi:hypothetical protein
VLLNAIREPQDQFAGVRKCESPHGPILRAMDEPDA